MFVQQINRRHHPLEGRLVALAVTVKIVQFGRPVNRQTNQKIVLGEEDTPLFVEQDTVGLQVVLDALAGLRYFFWSSTTRWKKSSPISVGSPPCQVKSPHRHPAPRCIGGYALPVANRSSVVFAVDAASLPCAGKNSRRNEIALRATRLDHRVKTIEVAFFCLGSFSSGSEDDITKNTLPAMKE